MVARNFHIGEDINRLNAEDKARWVTKAGKIKVSSLKNDFSRHVGVPSWLVEKVNSLYPGYLTEGTC
jgi:hypothetical protein